MIILKLIYFNLFFLMFIKIIVNLLIELTSKINIYEENLTFILTHGKFNL